MTWSDISEKASQSLVGWAVVAIAGGFVWLVRRILTNQKQIELMQAEFQARDELRGRDREDILEVKQDVKDLRGEIQKLFQRD